MKQTYITIGASAAGMGAVSRLRSLDKNAKIICISAEKDLPYNRCLLVDYLDKTKTKEEGLIKPETFFQENNIELLLNTKAVEIIPAKQKIVLADSSNLEYDKLFLGLGKSSSLPQIPGIQAEGVFTFYTLQDVYSIQRYIKQKAPKSVTIIGTGMTGIECADTISNLKISVNLVGRSKQILQAQLDSDGASLLENQITNKHKIKIYKSCYVTEILSTQNSVHSLQLSNGEKIKTDMVIFAGGAKPNITLAKNANIKTQGSGISTTKTMQTNIENIYAGGDICLIPNILTGKLVQSCMWPDAVMQGITAAQAMVGKPQDYPGTGH